MREAERDVVGAGDRAVGVERDRGGVGAARRNGTQRCQLELGIRSKVEGLLGVVGQHLVDDFAHRYQRQVVELPGVGNAVAVLVDRHGALGHREVGFRHDRGFDQSRTLRRDVRIDVPVECIPFPLALDGGVLDIGELPELAHRLNRIAQHVREIGGPKIPADIDPQLTCGHERCSLLNQNSRSPARHHQTLSHASVGDLLNYAGGVDILGSFIGLRCRQIGGRDAIHPRLEPQLLAP
ncbi:MAG: hypothetical protein CAPSK01_004472 [Candidatus Accumulibacter vicinus]|uniref:Uncharacterized protein n=1 Tax=Candidatus Accumulibacter vicinus TaxID=2954382 RepID=A0A084XV17_9PROT|nr:MAG: hypothetical protein CAPSK01_004472 [Candidatus Accumulibacter vicinus]